MAALGTRDGREILRDFDKLYEQGTPAATEGRALYAQWRGVRRGSLWSKTRARQALLPPR